MTDDTILGRASPTSSGTNAGKVEQWHNLPDLRDRACILSDYRAISGFTSSGTVYSAYIPRSTTFGAHERVTIGFTENNISQPGAPVTVGSDCLGNFVTLFDPEKGDLSLVPAGSIGKAFTATDSRADAIAGYLPSVTATLHLVTSCATLPREEGNVELSGRISPATADALAGEGPHSGHWLECHSPSPGGGYYPWSEALQVRPPLISFSVKGLNSPRTPRTPSQEVGRALQTSSPPA